MRSKINRGLCMAVSMALAVPVFAAQTRAFDVLHYAATLDFDIPAGEVRGEATLRFRAGETPLSQLSLDSGELVIDSATQNGVPLAFEHAEGKLSITLSEPLRAGGESRVTLRYHGKPAYGLEFAAERNEVYTIFSTSQWMPSVDAPDERATLELALRLPKHLQATAVGEALPSRRLEDGRIEHRWHLRAPMPGYVYGFAAGPYQHAVQAHGGKQLHYYAVDRSPAELREVFAASGDMLDFFADRAGLTYEGDYHQALVARTIGQEMAGLSLMSEAYGKRVLDDPTQLGLMAHEAAHQWWGNRVTCAGWEHFWLNEGFANFMTAAWLQHAQGEAAYQQMVTGWRTRVLALREKGADRALVFPDWNKPTADDRAVVYQKGALVLHLLRQELGEEVFWRGLRAYTQAHDGRSVVTADFQQAMETAAGRSLQPFFDDWVYGAAGRL
ncbi:M1 family metallopeptidase [Stenotrophomonas sp. Iso1]|uniref:M1 family metallopeptidase n=1 Tax=Stenotrophomonas sp. Iso1 TaxID=2977283 RepID=UPI0022B7BD1E|nr:M1 family metallopeptidase [Stenotrophomonas sp. Iso1]